MARQRRRRAPGGGRKPRGDFSRLTSPFAVRMPEGLRAQLKAAAAMNDRSEGQELLSRLQQSFDWPTEVQEAWGPRHIKGLAQLVVQVSRTVEGAVGVPPLGKPDHDLNWHKNAFTHRALTSAVNACLSISSRAENFRCRSVCRRAPHGSPASSVTHQPAIARLKRLACPALKGS